MEKSKKYFSHYYKEIQSTRTWIKDIIAGNEAETQKLIELQDFSSNGEKGVTKNNDDVEVEPIEEAPLDEKSKLIQDIKDLSLTLEDITNKLVDVKTDTTKLTEENKVIDEYIVKLMEQSKTFEPTDFWRETFFPLFVQISWVHVK